MPESVPVEVGQDGTVTAVVYRSSREQKRRITLVLAHGAGGNQKSRFLMEFVGGLSNRGIDVVTFNFLYSERGRRVPDRTDKLEACYRAVLRRVQARADLEGNALAIGGKSMGGRIASQIAAGEGTELGDLVGLVFLGYPLHPPGRPDQLRVKHLPLVPVAMLFVQGSRDSFGTPDEIRPLLPRLPVGSTLHVVEGGDHSLAPPKRSPEIGRRIFEEAQEKIASWLYERAGPAKNAE